MVACFIWIWYNPVVPFPAKSFDLVMRMTCKCCFCGKPFEEAPYTLTVTKENCETEQALFCHEACLLNALQDPKDLYIKVL